MDSPTQPLLSPDTVEHERIVIDSEPLSLPIDDEKLLELIDQRLTEAEGWYKENVKVRADTNKNFWKGLQLEGERVYRHEQRYVDNLIWQDSENRNAIAVSRLPDIMISPPDESEDKMERARELQQALKIKLEDDNIKLLLKDGLRHHDISFLAAIKVVWDPSIKPNGDYSFILIPPKDLVVDQTARIPHSGFTSDNMDIVGHWIEETIAQVTAKFPKKKDELLAEIGRTVKGAKPSVTKIRYLELEFTYFDEQGERYEGCCWKYGSVLLDKMKCPYYDWTGYEAVTDQPMMNEQGQTALNPMNGEPIYQTDTLFRNFFDRPRKNYIFFSYQNLQDGPYDSTTAIEQAIPIQRLINKRGRQITDLADRAAGKLAFGKGLSKETISQITNDPNQHIRLGDVDDVRQSIMSIPGTPPSPVLFQDLAANRQQLDSKFSTHSTTRGENVPGESGVSRQITREGDLSQSDDVASTMIQRVYYEMVCWSIQMMKVFYTEAHFINDMGPDGESVYIELKQDAIDDGIAVKVKPASTDKAVLRENALQLAARKAIDPFSLFEALEYPNPKEHTKRFLYFQLGEADGYAAYAKDLGIEDFQPPMPPQQMGPEGQEMGAEQAQQDLQALLQGQPVEPQGLPGEDYIAVFEQFIHSPDFDSLDPQIQSMVQDYIRKLQSSVDSQAQPPVQ